MKTIAEESSEQELDQTDKPNKVVETDKLCLSYLSCGTVTLQATLSETIHKTTHIKGAAIDTTLVVYIPPSHCTQRWGCPANPVYTSTLCVHVCLVSWTQLGLTAGVVVSAWLLTQNKWLCSRVSQCLSQGAELQLKWAPLSQLIEHGGCVGLAECIAYSDIGCESVYSHCIPNTSHNEYSAWILLVVQLWILHVTAALFGTCLPHFIVHSYRPQLLCNAPISTHLHNEYAPCRLGEILTEFKACLFSYQQIPSINFECAFTWSAGCRYAVSVHQNGGSHWPNKQWPLI